MSLVLLLGGAQLRNIVLDAQPGAISLSGSAATVVSAKTLSASPTSLAAGGSSDSNTVSLLHFNGADASTTITDDTGKTWTAAGNAQLDTGITPKFGSASLLLDGTGDYAESADHADWDFGTGDFTVEAWVRTSTAGFFKNIVSRYVSGGAGSWYWYLDTGGALKMGGTASVYSSGSVALDNTWQHVAVQRVSDVFYFCINGTVYTCTGGSGADLSCDQALRVGDGFAGNIDEVRVSKGIARLPTSGTYSVPSAEFSTGASATATMVIGRAVVADSASFSQTGTAADLAKTTAGAYSLDCQPGSTAATGAQATTTADKLADSTAGSLSLTGSSATLTKILSYSLDCSPASIAVSGADGTLARALLIGASAGAATLSGAAATVSVQRAIDASAGANSLSGASATWVKTSLFNAQSGTFSASGTDASLSKTLSYDLPANAGSFALSGGSASGAATREIQTATATLAVSGAAAGLTASRTAAADPAALALSGSAADLQKIARNTIVADPAAMSVSAADAALDHVIPVFGTNPARYIVVPKTARIGFENGVAEMPRLGITAPPHQDRRLGDRTA